MDGRDTAVVSDGGLAATPWAMSSIHHHERRPGTWGAGFLVADPRSASGYVVHTFEHEVLEDGSVRRRRIAMEAMARGFAPCTPYREARTRQVAYSPRRPVIRYCFEIAPDDTVVPHVPGHAEWLQPEHELVLALLDSLGLRRPDDDPG